MTGAARCEEVQAMAGELALGVVSGRERADGLAHLSNCRSCKALVADLAQSADALLVLGPSAEPPLGFESAVRQRLQDAGARARPVRQPVGRRALPRRRWAWVAAIAAGLVLVAGAVLVARGQSSPAVARTRAATMATPGGTDVGRVVLTGQPDTVFVALPGWRQLQGRDPGYGYRLRVTLDGGRTRDLGPVRLADPEATWGTVVPVDVRTVRSVAMVDDQGRVLCSANLPI